MRKRELARRLTELEDLFGRYTDIVDRRLHKLEEKVHPPSNYSRTHGLSGGLELYDLPDRLIGLVERLTSLEARVAEACPSKEQLADIARSLDQGGSP